MTRSPEGSVLTSRVICLYCSAIRGEMLDLNPPTPTPMTTRPRAKQATEQLGFVMTHGVAAMMRMMWPTNATAIAIAMVL